MAAAIAGAQEKNGAVPAGSKVKVDLSGRRIDDVLPFHVPYVLTGTVDPGAARLEVEFAETTTRRKACRNALEKEWKEHKPQPTNAQKEASVDACVAQGADLVWRPVPPSTWTPLGAPSDSPATFAVGMPALEAERYYRFRFQLSKRTTAKQEQDFSRTAPVALDKLFWTVESSSLDSATAVRLRELLRTELKRAMGSERLVATEGIFSDTASWARIREDFGRIVAVGVLQPQGQFNQAAASYRVASSPLLEQLKRLADHASAQRLLLAGEGDAEIKALIASHKAGADIVGADQDLVSRWAAGQSESGIAYELVEQRDDKVVDQFVANFATTRERLRTLQDLIERLTVRPGPYADNLDTLVKKKAITRDDIRAARALAVSPTAGVPPVIEAAREVLDQAQQAAGRAAERLRDRKRGIDGVVSTAVFQSRSALAVEAGTTVDHETSHSRYIGLDAGVLYGFGINGVQPYVGVNLYLRPVNKNAPLSQYGKWYRRLSFTAGALVKKIEDGAKTRDDLPLGRTLMAGTGFLVSQSIRVGGGLMIFRRKDPSQPLRSDMETTGDPYVSLSFDIDPQKLPSPFKELFGG